MPASMWHRSSRGHIPTVSDRGLEHRGDPLPCPGTLSESVDGDILSVKK